MTDRQLATVRVIDDISPIEGADRIEVAKVGGWNVVVGKGDFSAGEKVIYFEIDSALPLEDSRFEHLAPRGSRIVDDMPVHVLRTIRLRGVYSQGLVMPLRDFEPEVSHVEYHGNASLDEVLGINKWEPPVPVNLSGEIAGQFFTGVQKTDAERVQNIDPETYHRLVTLHEWIPTLKLDGTSATFVRDGDELRVASRNWELRRSDENTHWQVADQYDLENVIPPGWVIQGEIYGPGIQKNRLKVNDLTLKVFRVTNNYGLDVPRDDWPTEIHELAVPILDMELPDTIDEAVEQVNGLKYGGVLAEGVVWHEASGAIPYGLDRPCFKVINNKYLVKNGE